MKLTQARTVIQNYWKEEDVDMTITFKQYVGRDIIKQWPNWTGVIPNIGDKVVLHFGDNNEEEQHYFVQARAISGTNPDNIDICLV